MRLAWMTDLHLNFVDAARVDDFLASVRDRADAVAISDDFAEIQASDNIRVLTGEAEYGKPRINGILEVE